MGPGCSPHLSPRMPDCPAAGSGAPESCPELRAAPKLGPVPASWLRRGSCLKCVPLPCCLPQGSFWPRGDTCQQKWSSPTTPTVCHLQWAGVEVRVAGGLWGSRLLPPSTPS